MSRLVPSSCAWRMLGRQLVFHRPAVLGQRRLGAVDQVCPTPGKAQVVFKVAMAVLPCRSTDDTVTRGCRAPMPVTSGWYSSLTSVPVAPTNSTAVRSLLGQAGGQLGGRPVRGVGGARVGVGIPVEQPASTASETRQTAERRRRTGPSCHRRAGERRGSGVGGVRELGRLRDLAGWPNVPGMGIYSTRPGRLAGQIFSDLFVLGWSIGCGWSLSWSTRWSLRWPFRPGRPLGLRPV